LSSSILRLCLLVAAGVLSFWQLVVQFNALKLLFGASQEADIEK
jgi:hypothetical protein